MIILGTLSGIGMCYHLMRTSWRVNVRDALLVIGYAAMVLATANALY